MKIKGQNYEFKELSKASSLDSFQEQINKLQLNINNCRREINNFDVYRITAAITDLKNIDAVKNKLLPGEAAVITAPTEGDWHTGQLILRLNQFDYVNLEPFQTGTYYPSSLKVKDGSNYLLRYSFTEKVPIQESATLSEEVLSEPAKTIEAEISTLEENYYYSFAENNADGTPNFMKQLTSSITFAKKASRPIIRFFIKRSDSAFEEVILDYNLSLNNNNYTLKTDTYPLDCWVAIK